MDSIVRRRLDISARRGWSRYRLKTKSRPWRNPIQRRSNTPGFEKRLFRPTLAAASSVSEE